MSKMVKMDYRIFLTPVWEYHDKWKKGIEHINEFMFNINNQ